MKFGRPLFAALFAICLSSSVAEAKPDKTLGLPNNTCQLSDVKTLSMVNSIACAGVFSGNDSQVLDDLDAYLEGAFAGAYGPWAYIGKNEGDGFGPFTGNPKTNTGELLFDSPMTGYFGIVLKAGPGFNLYVLDGGAEGTGGVKYNTAALNSGLSHAGLWDGGASSVVPEPSTYLLMAAGLAGMGVMVRRRRKS